jgi:hypothetical protein
MRLLCDVRTCDEPANGIVTSDAKLKHRINLCSSHYVAYDAFTDSANYCWDVKARVYVPFSESYSRWLGEQERRAA